MYESRVLIGIIRIRKITVAFMLVMVFVFGRIWQDIVVK